MDRFINDFKKYYKYAIYSAKSELKAEVASSYLNWVWWILEPLCFMLIYSFIFGVVFDAREENFPIFIFIGIMAWDFFNRNIKNSVKMVILYDWDFLFYRKSYSITLFGYFIEM